MPRMILGTHFHFPAIEPALSKSDSFRLDGFCVDLKCRMQDPMKLRLRERLMFQRIFLSALGSGIVVGLILALLHQVTTVPIIIQAEKYEQSGAHSAYFRTPGGFRLSSAAMDVRTTNLARSHVMPVSTGHDHAWTADGRERMLFTILTTLITSVGFAFLLVGLFALKGDPVDGRRGVLWGMGAFAAFVLAPAFGLQPELPGSATAALDARQVWWLATAAATGLGLAALAFCQSWAIRVGALVVMVAPHVVGAPHPHELTSTAPAELAGQFAATSIAIGAVFWTLLGWFSGTIYHKLSIPE